MSVARNAYAAKLMAAKAAVKEEERKAIVRRCITTVYQASVITLNEQFGFGPERAEKFRRGMEEIVNEYGAFMEQADVDYADDALERRYNQVMGCKDE